MGPNKSRDKTPHKPWGTREAQEDLGFWGTGPLKMLQDPGLRLRGLSKGPEDSPLRASRHGGGYTIMRLRTQMCMQSRTRCRRLIELACGSFARTLRAPQNTCGWGGARAFPQTPRKGIHSFLGSSHLGPGTLSQELGDTSPRERPRDAIGPAMSQALAPAESQGRCWTPAAEHVAEAAEPPDTTVKSWWELSEDCSAVATPRKSWWQLSEESSAIATPRGRESDHEDGAAGFSWSRIRTPSPEGRYTLHDMSGAGTTQFSKLPLPAQQWHTQYPEVPLVLATAVVPPPPQPLLLADLLQRDREECDQVPSDRACQRQPRREQRLERGVAACGPGQTPSDAVVLSIGSVGHPQNCALPCKYSRGGRVSLREARPRSRTAGPRATLGTGWTSETLNCIVNEFGRGART